MSEALQIEELKRYIFHEMTEKECEALEERFFEDSDYFYEFLSLENDLIDCYAIGKISGKDLKRFEQSLAKSPERYEKIANARALQTLIAEENSVPIPASNLWERISSFFNFQKPVFQFAAGALAILVVCAAGFLIYKNWQAQNDFAEIETRREAERIEQENRRKQLEEEKKRLEKEQDEEKQKPLENINGNTQDANNNQQKEVEKRKNRIEEIKRKIERLPDKKAKPLPDSNEIIPSKELLAVAIIPTGKSGSTSAIPTGKVVGSGTKQKVKVTQILLAEKDFGSFEIVSNGETIAEGNIPEKAKSFVFFLQTDVTNFEIKVNERGVEGNSKTLGTYKLELSNAKTRTK